jgi:hypothetical protein
VAPATEDWVKIHSVPDSILLVKIVPSPIDNDSLADCETENVCRVLVENEVKVGEAVHVSPIAMI